MGKVFGIGILFPVCRDVGASVINLYSGLGFVNPPSERGGGAFFFARGPVGNVPVRGRPLAPRGRI